MNFKNVKNIGLIIIEFLMHAFSLNEFRRFFNDNRGGLVLSLEDIEFLDNDWIEYKSLKIDKNLKSINPQDLPSNFCPKACKLVDEFHKKTVNEEIEWMLYFDYTTAEVVYCWKGDEGKISVEFKKAHLIGKNIASIHSHPKGLYSFPSPDNFDILANEYEDFEIITSLNSFWIVEFNGKIDENCRKAFQQAIGKDMSDIIRSIRNNENVFNIDVMTEEIMGNYLINELNNKIKGIDLILIKKEYV